jgi:hypothetical protein
VTFSPTANGDSPCSLTISHNSAGGSQSVQLDGTGLIRSDLSVSPLQIVFPGNTLIGIGAGGQTLTLQNTSAQALTIGAISISPSVFGISANTCSTMIAPTATCTLTMTFSPTAVGPVSGTITIPHNGAGSPQVVSIFGTATTQLSFTPATVNFGDQEAGTTGPQSVLSVGNGSSAHPVTIENISVTGDFQIAFNPCPISPAQLPGFFGCAVDLTFTPSSTGTRTGILSVTASDLPTPHQIPLTGNGVSAGLEISPASLSFGNTFVGSSSAGQSVTISNVSGGVVTLQSISASGPFQQSNNCGTTLAFGGTCTAQITFSPTVLGNANGSLTVQDNASGNPHPATLSGVATGTAIKLSSTDLIISNRALNTTSPASPVVVMNQMSTSISISAITTSGDFGPTQQ